MNWTKVNKTKMMVIKKKKINLKCILTMNI